MDNNNNNNNDNSIDQEKLRKIVIEQEKLRKIVIDQVIELEGVLEGEINVNTERLVIKSKFLNRCLIKSVFFYVRSYRTLGFLVLDEADRHMPVDTLSNYISSAVYTIVYTLARAIILNYIDIDLLTC